MPICNSTGNRFRRKNTGPRQIKGATTIAVHFRTTGELAAPRLAENERQLWAAVMQRAVDDLKVWRHASEAHNWIVSGRQAVGSFIWTCSVLGLDPDVVRPRLEAIYQRRAG